MPTYLSHTAENDAKEVAALLISKKAAIDAPDKVGLKWCVFFRVGKFNLY